MKSFLPSLLLSFAFINTVSAQNIGIGTTTPRSKFHVDGTAWFQGDNTPLPGSAGSGVAVGFPVGAPGGYVFAFDYLSFTARDLWLNSPGGNVLIGSTLTAQGKLDIRSSGKRAVYASTNSGEALYGYSTGGYGLYAYSNSSLAGYFVSQTPGGGAIIAEGVFVGLQGRANGSDGNRQSVRGELDAGVPGGYAGIFVNGTTGVFGTLTKTAGAFLIDHPVDPEHKFLMHSFVESPDMKNIYDGTITTDANGQSVVTLPGWFQALNIEYRYQLTCIGQFAQAIVQQEIVNNSFVIKTDKPNVKVSWQVTGIRNDPYARDQRIPNEKDKTPSEVGKYIYPQGYGKSEFFYLDILKPISPYKGGVTKPVEN